MFVNLGQTWILVVLGIGIGGALIVLANVVSDDAERHELRGGRGLYWPLVFFVAPVGLLAWLATTYRKVDRDEALIRAFGVGVFNTVYAAVFAASAAAGWR